MTISVGVTAAEIREFVHEYQLQPYGQKGSWLAARGVSYDRLQRWRDAVYAGDLDRGLVPREASGVTVPPSKRTALEKQRAAESAAHEVELARLRDRIAELEGVNDALGKAIGLLHAMNEHEPAGAPTRTELSGS